MVLVLLSIFWTEGAISAMASDAVLTIFRFHTQENYNRALTGTYRLEGGLWTPAQLGRVKLEPPVPADPTCATVLDQLQNYSLNVMARVGYLSPSDFVKHASVIKNLFPDQITFLQMGVPKLKSEIAAHPADYPAHRLSLIRDLLSPDHQYVVQAGMWVVSGQTMYPKRSDVFKEEHPGAAKLPPTWQSAIPFSDQDIPRSGSDLHLIIQGVTPMPWQLDSDLFKEATLALSPEGYLQLNREEYPLCWELGRAAQDEPELMEEMLQAALSVIDEEILVTFQSRRDDAYVFAHALDEARARRFRLVEFRPLVGVPGVLVAPFNKLAERYPPGRRSSRVARLREWLHNKPELPDALNMLRRTQTYFRAELDVLAPDLGIAQRSPIVMHDFSRNYLLLLRILAQNYGLSQSEAIDAAISMSQFRYDPDYVPHIQEPLSAGPFFRPFASEEIVRVTNLDPNLAQNPDYLPLVILGTYNYLKFRYSELSMPDPEQPLRVTGTKVALQTTSPQVIRAAMRIGGIKVHTPSPAPGVGDIETFVFTLDQIKSLMLRYPKVAVSAEHAVSQGFWFFRDLNAQPIKF